MRRTQLLLLCKFYNECHFDLSSFDLGFCLLQTGIFYKWQVRAINKFYILPVSLSLVRGWLNSLSQLQLETPKEDSDWS